MQIRVPPGTVMLWRNQILHAVAPNISDTTRLHIYFSCKIVMLFSICLLPVSLTRKYHYIRPAALDAADEHDGRLR